MSRLALVLLCYCTLSCAAKQTRDFYTERSQVLATEDSMYFGSDLVLNTDEMFANSVLMDRKYSELDAAFQVGLKLLLWRIFNNFHLLVNYF